MCSNLIKEATKPMSTLNNFTSLQDQPPEVFSKKKGVLKNFTKFTGKRFCQSHFFNKVAGLSLQLY